MLQEISGNIFDFEGTITSPVNTQGFSGAGLALAIGQKYPEADRWFSNVCRNASVIPGVLMYYKPDDILFFPTKHYVQNPSKLEYLESGLLSFLAKYKQWGIKNIAFPALGSGYGGLDFEPVKQLMHIHLDPLPINTVLYLPH